MASEIKLNVLGDLQLVRDGHPVVLPPSRKTRALLAYLAVVRQPQRRERLCEMFWDVPDDPRGALRWSLSKIRGILNGSGGDVFTADRNTVAIAQGAVSTDMSSVQKLMSKTFESLGRRELETLAHSFRGRFLDDLSLPRCPNFEAWRTGHANEMEILRLKTLRRLVETLSAEDPEAALRYAQDLHVLAPDEMEISRMVNALAKTARAKSVTSHSVEVDPSPPAGQRQIADRATEMVVRDCTTRDGVRVAYAMTGSGPPMVRAAHWMSHLRFDTQSPVWRHWIRELSARSTLIRYDERGNGMSQWNVEDLSFEAMVADLESIVDAAGYDKIVLLGVSQGCAISVAYAVRHPERVRGLVLYGGYVKGWRARGDPEEIRLREAMATLMRQGWGSDDPVFRQVFTSTFIPGATRQQMDWYNELQRMTVTPENAYRLAESFAEIDVADLLGRVTVPTLVMHAKGDRVVPISSGLAFAAGIPNARYAELDSSNHILLETEPAFALFIDHLRRFADEVNLPARQLGVGSGRRLVSVLVADLYDTENAGADPEAFAEAIDPLIDAIIDLVKAQGGTVFEIREGMVAAAFGADRAVEEHALLACRAALSISERVMCGAVKTVSLRIAIDSGEAFIREAPGVAGTLRISGSVAKDPIGLAAELDSGVIALTARARESAGGFISTALIGSVGTGMTRNGGPIFELIAENRALSRWHLRMRQGLTPLVGRGDELASLSRAWQSAREGEAQIVSVIGEAGIGKSRLVHEFVGSLGFKAVTFVEAGSEEINRKVSHELVKRLFLSLLGLSGNEEEATIIRAVDRGLGAFKVSERHRPALLYAIGQPVNDPSWRHMQGAQRALQVREACVACVRGAASRKPLLVLLEDMHWADAQSLAAVRGLAAGIAGHRILLLVTSRPDADPPLHLPSSVTAMRLVPLSKEQGRQLATTLLGNDPSLGDLHQLISERAAGIPLFVEEIVGQLVQLDSIVGTPGKMRLMRSLEDLAVPATIQSLIAVRVERIDPAARLLLQAAAVIGAIAPRSLLEKVSELSDAFEPALVQLRQAELLFFEHDDAEDRYVFKHALVRDATYASLSAADRRALHVRTLATLCEMPGMDRTKNPEVLAHHAVRAEDWESSTRHLISAADRAIEHSAYATAAEFLERAVETAARLPTSGDAIAISIDIRIRMRVAYMVIGQFEKAIRRLAEAQALARDSGDMVRLAATLLHTSYVYSTHGRTTEALAAAAEARSVGLISWDGRYVAEADLAAAQAHMIIGAARPAMELLLPHREAFTQRWADSRHGFLITRSVWYRGSLAATLGLLGMEAEAEDEIGQSLRLAQETGRPIDRYAAGYFESLVRIVSGCDERFLVRLAGLAEESRERAPFPFHPWLTATLGHAQIANGRRDEASGTLKAALELAEHANMPHFMVYASAMLAVADARPGDRASIEDLHDALDAARATGDIWIEHEVLMALASTDNESDPRCQLLQAIEVSERAGYATFAARASALLSAEGIQSVERDETGPDDRSDGARRRSRRVRRTSAADPQPN